MSDAPAPPPDDQVPPPGAPRDYPLAARAQSPLEVQNWRPLVNWLLAIPHVIVLYGLWIVAESSGSSRSSRSSSRSESVPRRSRRWSCGTSGASCRTCTGCATSTRPSTSTSMSADNRHDPASVDVEDPGEMNRWLSS